MTRRERTGTGRVFEAVAFMVLGAAATLLLGLGGDPAPEAARGPAPGPADVGFSQDMIVHHQQAVTMAQAARGRVRPAVAQLAAGIELNQVREIGQLQGWLALWNAPQVPSGRPMAWMEGEHRGDGRTTPAGLAMPGMASVQEVERLGRARGRDADAWFLKLMIRHHEGGMIMATAAAARAAHPRVRALATLMAAEQRKENATMSGLLAALGQRPLPSPTPG